MHKKNLFPCSVDSGYISFAHLFFAANPTGHTGRTDEDSYLQQVYY